MEHLNFILQIFVPSSRKKKTLGIYIMYNCTPAFQYFYHELSRSKQDLITTVLYIRKMIPRKNKIAAHRNITILSYDTPDNCTYHSNNSTNTHESNR